MKKSLIILVVSSVVIFVADQWIKQIFLNGFRWQSEYIDLILTFNKGVAFSMFAFLGDNLKYIQLALIFGVVIYAIVNRELLKEYALAFGIILGAGGSNIYDRFIHEGVVDYVFWHKWFNFAVFNFADAMIDFAIVLILFQGFLKHKKST